MRPRACLALSGVCDIPGQAQDGALRNASIQKSSAGEEPGPEMEEGLPKSWEGRECV